MQDTLIDQGINLMLFGMGTVFVFLTILVFATSLMSKVVNRLVPQEEPTPSSSPVNTPSTEPHAVSPNIVSAIQKAIAEHRQR
jgi:oxaloacetate decarboxylase gamma subunit